MGFAMSPKNVEERLKDGGLLPDRASDRKAIPVGTGVLDYFPAALAEIAKVSLQSNDKHNPGEPLHWARHKSPDEPDALIRHFLERGTRDSDGLRHTAKMAWRALALLQKELEAEGAPIARGATFGAAGEVLPAWLQKGVVTGKTPVVQSSQPRDVIQDYPKYAAETKATRRI